MAYAPQTGLGSTVTIASVAYAVRDCSVSMSRETIKSSRLSDLYDTYISGRINVTLSVNLIVDATVASVFASSFMSQTAVFAPVTFAIVDFGTYNTYNGSAIVTSCNHTMTGDDVDIIAMEMTVTGTMT